MAASVEATGHVYAEPSAVHEVYRLLLSELTDRDIENGLAESDNWLRKQTSTVNAYVRTFWLLFLCVRGRYDLALRQSEALGAQLRSVDLVHMADHLFYRGLAAAVLAGDARGRKRRLYCKILAQSLARIRRWARAGPDFIHMMQMLEAERARLRGRLTAARRLYEKAAGRAREEEFLHHAALTLERYAGMLFEMRRETEGAEVLREASAIYEKWGFPKGASLAQEAADALVHLQR